jgi:MoaA/NifB/PqqE/SkfB family radical SAM enzyme
MKNEVMEVKDAHNYLMEATAVSNLESFMVFGGEPMLYPRRVIAIFRKASELKIPSIDLLTNGVWGKNKRRAEELAKDLKEAGLNTVGVSVDAFHLQYIPLEYPRNAASALLKAGVERVTWNVALVESLDAPNEYDMKTNQILTMLKPVGIEAHFINIIPVGRATDNLRRFLKPTSLDGPCKGDPIMSNVLIDPKSICIEPSGEVDICWNLPIGNAKQKPLSQIITEYNWQDYPTIRVLVEQGPMSLLRSIKRRFGEYQKNEFIDKCHLCIETRKAYNLC